MKTKTLLILFISFYNIILLNNNKVMIISVPKCGTWMLAKCIRLMTGRKNGMHRFQREKLLRGYKFIDDEFYHNKKKPWVPKDAIHFFTPSIEILEKMLKEVKDTEYLVGHLVYKKEYEDLLKKYNCKVIFLIRDPRAQLVSRVNYTYKNGSKFLGLQHLKFDELLSAFIGQNDKKDFNNLYTSHICFKNKPKELPISNLYEFYNNFLEWLNSDVLVVRFEDLVGPKGGGSKDLQEKTLKNIANFINVDLPQNKLNHVINKMFGGTSTFSKGQIDAWKKNFKKEHMDAFNNVNGQQLLKQLGYEL